MKQRSAHRSSLLFQVRTVLPPKLAQAVSTAGMDESRLTIGVVSAAWASRLRYSSELIRAGVSQSSGLPIQKVRICVVPPDAG